MRLHKKQVSRDLETDVAKKKSSLLIANYRWSQKKRNREKGDLEIYKSEPQKNYLWKKQTLNTHLESLKIKQQMLSTEISNRNVIIKQIKNLQKKKSKTFAGAEVASRK
ncbi:MAG: hypothetical protein CM1200mP3_10340 [Chloroflexota bacterium]|nr:MAG: hypothetical protein CM1200mP3_10340 [Chloroflexota bacterium]